MKRIIQYLIGVVCIVFGVMFIVRPEQSLEQLVFYFGACMLVVGIFKIIGSIVSRSYFLVGYSVLGGVFTFLIGLILMINANSMLKVLPWFIGSTLIFSSLIPLIFMFGTHSLFIHKYLLLRYIVMFILGVLILTTPIVTILFSGISFGIIAIIVGVYQFISYDDSDEVVYRVRVK